MRYLIIFLMFFGLSACNFTPVYKQDGVGSELRAIDVNSKGGREAQLLQVALEDKLATSGAPRFTLTPSIVVGTQALSIESDGTTRRYRLIGKSQFALTDNDTGKVVYADSIERLGSYNISDDDYSTYIAGRDAQKQVIDAVAEAIRLRLIAHFGREGR